MLHYVTKTEKIVYVHSITCSKCKIVVSDSDYDFSERIEIEGQGGYNSIIGDGRKYRLDLCESCFLELCGDYIEYEGE